MRWGVGETERGERDRAESGGRNRMAGTKEDNDN